MKKIAALLTAGLCFFSSITMAKEIVVLHTNDIHGGVENNVSLSRLAQYKKDLQSKGTKVAVVDAGDVLQGSVLANNSQGASVLRLMKQTGYDFMIPGAHDFDYGVKHFLELSNQLQAEYYCINLWNREADKAALTASKIMDFGNTKIGFIGFTSPAVKSGINAKSFHNTIGRPAYVLEGADDSKKLYKQLQREINDLRHNGADYVIMVAHTDIENSPWSAKAIAGNTKGINCIITGGSHEQIDDRMVKSRNNKDILVVQAGQKMQAVGKLTIDKKCQFSSELLYNLGVGDKAVAAAAAMERKQLAPIWRQQVGYSNVYLYVKDPGMRERFVGSHETNMGDFAADAYRFALGADVVLLNSSELTGELGYGNITFQSLMEAFPHEYSLCLIEATGKQILDALEMGVHKFPVEYGGFMQVSGLSYTIDTGTNSRVDVDKRGCFQKVDSKYRVRDVLVGGKPLELDKLYRVGGSSFVLKHLGMGMTMFKGCKVIEEGKILQAEAAKLYIKNKLKGQITWKYHNPYGDGRIKFR